mmetsp:Transcript_11102/g.24858  ORF Transcript_11102/g.24858 Transcript_11102/m.24858 type:complete len:99 (-) Transcript_11102:171-467(-)
MYATKAQILLFLKQPQDVLDCLAEFDRRNGGKLEDTLRRRFSNATTPSRSLDPERRLPSRSPRLLSKEFHAIILRRDEVTSTGSCEMPLFYRILRHSH